VNVSVKEDIRVTTFIVTSKVVSEHPKLNTAKVSANHDKTWGRREELSEFMITRNLG